MCWNLRNGLTSSFCSLHSIPSGGIASKNKKPKTFTSIQLANFPQPSEAVQYVNDQTVDTAQAPAPTTREGRAILLPLAQRGCHHGNTRPKAVTRCQSESEGAGAQGRGEG